MHFVNDIGDEREFLLVAEEVDEKVKIFEGVLSFIEEGFEISIDSLVDISMVIFLG